jgi:hypothetical protein
MGADNTFGETNFNPEHLTVKESIADIVYDLKQLSYDSRYSMGYEFEYNGLEYYLSIAFERKVVPTPTPQDLPQEYKMVSDELWVFSYDVFDKEGKETFDKDGIVKQIIEQYNA